MMLAALAAPASAAEVWREVPWPWPRDAWPAGRAFRCEGGACGAGLETYVRPKLGFCNCSTGVTEDAEVDGVADLDMVSTAFAPAGTGVPRSIGGMAGRSRAYTLTKTDGSTSAASGLAIASRCDLIVAASVGPHAGKEAAEDAVSALLGSEPVLRWIRSLLGSA